MGSAPLDEQFTTWPFDEGHPVLISSRDPHSAQSVAASHRKSPPPSFRSSSFSPPSSSPLSSSDNLLLAWRIRLSAKARKDRADRFEDMSDADKEREKARLKQFQDERQERLGKTPGMLRHKEHAEKACFLKNAMKRIQAGQYLLDR